MQCMFESSITFCSHCYLFQRDHCPGTAGMMMQMAHLKCREPGLSFATKQVDVFHRNGVNLSYHLDGG